MSSESYNKAKALTFYVFNKFYNHINNVKEEDLDRFLIYFYIRGI